MDFPNIQIGPDEDLDGAYQRTIEAFRGGGLKIEDVSSLCERLLTIRETRSFAVRRAEVTHLFTICPGRLDDETQLLFLNDQWLLREALGGTVMHHFLSGYPLPPQVSYYFGNRPGGFFSLHLAGKLERVVLRSLSPETIPQIALTVVKYVEIYFGEDWDLDDIRTLDRLDALLLTHIRSERDHAVQDGGHCPTIALIGLGCVAGETIARQLHQRPELEAFWVFSELHNPKIPVIRIELVRRKGVFRRKMIENTVFASPIEKTFKLFENGQEDAMSFYFTALIHVIEGRAS